MDRQEGFTQALERGAAFGNIAVPVTLFITPNGYLYCYKYGTMTKTELVYRRHPPGADGRSLAGLALGGNA
jgi:hypothetical protein